MIEDDDWGWSPPPDLAVWVEDDEPVGVIYGPHDQPVAVVWPDRQPFGFTHPNINT